MLTPAQRRRLRRLRVSALLLVGSAYVLSFFHRVAPAAISSELQRAFEASGAALGFLAAAYFYVYTVMQIPIGMLADTMGVRRIVTIGGLIAGAGSLLFGLAPTLEVAVAGRVLVGFGVSAMFLAMLKINALWFRERHFGTLTGLTVLIGNIGAVVAAAPLVWVLGFASWRSVFVALGMFSILLSALTWLVVRDQPGDAGLPSMRELDGLAPHAPHGGRWWHGLGEVVRNRDIWPPFLPALGVAGSMLTFAGLWGVPYLTDVHHMARAEAATHTSLLLLGFALGGFAVGALSDRLGRRKPVILAGVVLYLASWLPILFQWSMVWPWSGALMFLMGLGAAGFTLSWAVAKEVSRPALSGTATSVVNTGVFLGVALFQPLIGWILDLGWDQQLVNGAPVYTPQSYLWGFGFLFGVAVVGLVGAALTRETRCRNVYAQK